MFEDQGECSTLPERIRAIRIDLFGECGGPVLARLLQIPDRKLERLETGGPIAAEVILALIEVTGANPRWLQSGDGERYSRREELCLQHRSRGGSPA
jgi:hypothetical protein